MVNSNRKNWKALARKAANEQDPKKLLSIVEELNKALEERENQLRGGVSKRIATLLRVTPAMQAGLTDHLWNLEELVGLLECNSHEAVA